MKLRLLFIVIMLCIAGGASADDADRLIADFDRKADVASANKFFEFLDRREFTDSKIVFSNAVPADSLARYKTEFDTDRLREEVERTYGARRRDIVVGVCVLAVVVLAAVAIHRRRMRRYRTEMLALIRDVESLYGTPEPEKAPTEAAENSFERMVVDVVRQGLASGDDISVSAIASRLNLGEQTFRRRFVAETGKQPKTFVTAIQMEMAARLLASDTTVPVAEVARACGFDDASAFSHAFKKAYSCSPTQFRQKRA